MLLNYSKFRGWVEDNCPNPSEINSLCFSNEGLSYLLDKVFKCTSIILLNVCNNNLTFFQRAICNFKNLERLGMFGNKITTIPIEIGQLDKLEEFNIGSNDIVLIPAEIGLLKSLKIFTVSYNRQLGSIPVEIGQLLSLTSFNAACCNLTTIPIELFQLVNLTELYLAQNNFISIPPEIGRLVSLQLLVLSNNNLTFIPAEIGQCVNLKCFDVKTNKLSSLPVEFGNLVSLQVAHLEHNNLTSIPAEVGQLTSLEFLDIAYNNITFLPSTLVNCRRLDMLKYQNNPIEYVPPNVRRFIERQNHAQGIYTDHQSVHNSGIQTSIKDSIMRLLSVKPTYDFEGVTALVLSDQTLTLFAKESLVEYCKDESVHTVLNLTFSDLLTAVWNRIVANENAVEIKTILNTEMMDAECKCFTGRISRLVNCLNGFDSSITITINDNEQLGNIILLVKEKLEASVEGYNAAKHCEFARVELKERGYSEDVIEEWLGYIV